MNYDASFIKFRYVVYSTLFLVWVTDIYNSLTKVCQETRQKPTQWRGNVIIAIKKDPFSLVPKVFDEVFCHEKPCILGFLVIIAHWRLDCFQQTGGYD